MTTPAQPTPAQLLASSPLLAQLDEQHRAEFAELATFLDIGAANAVIVREGEVAENFYVIVSGEAEVLKRDPTDGHEFPIARLGAGDHFGETALFREVKRTATIRSCSPMRIAMLRAREIRESPSSYSWLAPFLLALARLDASRLDRLTNQTVDGMRTQVVGSKRLIALSRLLVWAIVSLVVYAFALALTQLLGNMDLAERISNVTYIGLCTSLVWLMADSRSPLSSFGVRVSETWQREIAEALAVTGACALVLTLLKWVLISVVPAYDGVALFGDDPFPLLEISLFYAMLMPLQELCVRGILQTSFEGMFEDRRQTLYAILLSNALFAAVHVHVGPYYAMMAVFMFVPGVLWGFLYARQRSLLGVSVSHVLLGIWALRVLGLADLFHPH